ncbi:ribonuclease P protein component [Petrachloros mirabilis]
MSHGGAERSIFLRASRDIEYVKQHGRRISTVLFNMLVCEIDRRGSRVGIVVGKRFGIAVRRNRAKRLFRELTRQVQTELVSGHDVLIFPKRDALDVSFEELKRAWMNTFRRQGLIRSH